MPALFERGLSGVSLVEPWALCGHRHWRVFDGRDWIVMLSGEECPNFAISELGGGTKGRVVPDV